MSSMDIHLCLANKLKEKFNMGNDFVFGQILPDLKAKSGEGNTSSHYLKECIVDGYLKRLPDIERYEHENYEDLRNFDEQKLGYLMHLVQDTIWYNDIIPKYAKYLPNRRFDVLDIVENKIIPTSEFSRRIYSDYALINEYQKNSFGYTNDYFLGELVESDLFDEYKEIILNKIINPPLSKSRRINYFSSKDSDRYVKYAYMASEDMLMQYVKRKR